jgi:hypothetical protein
LAQAHATSDIQKIPGNEKHKKHHPMGGSWQFEASVDYVGEYIRRKNSLHDTLQVAEPRGRKPLTAIGTSYVPRARKSRPFKAAITIWATGDCSGIFDCSQRKPESISEGKLQLDITESSDEA